MKQYFLAAFSFLILTLGQSTLAISEDGSSKLAQKMWVEASVALKLIGVSDTSSIEPKYKSDLSLFLKNYEALSQEKKDLRQSRGVLACNRLFRRSGGDGQGPC